MRSAVTGWGRRGLFGGSAGLLVAVLAAGSASAGVPGRTERVGISTHGNYPDGESGVEVAGISGGGRFVLLESPDPGLVPGDTNGALDVFVRDRVARTTERVSVGDRGQQAPTGVLSSLSSSISDNGRYVTFTSSDPLVAGDTNGKSDVFLRDRKTGTTIRVSLTADGKQLNADSAVGILSGDGRYVAFLSAAVNLVPGRGSSDGQIYVRDRRTGVTRIASLSSTGAQVRGGVYDFAFSDDGSTVAFASRNPNVVPGDTNRTSDVFVRDLVRGRTTRVSVSSAGRQGDGYSFGPALSGDGRFVLFSSVAGNLVAGDTNGVSDAFVHDRVTGRTSRVSVSSTGRQVLIGSLALDISGDGRYVTFQSGAPKLVPGDRGGFQDVFRADRVTGEVVRVSLGVADNQIPGNNFAGFLSDDGRVVAFGTDKYGGEYVYAFVRVLP